MAAVRKQYNSLDLAKFICAVFILILHTEPFSSYSRLLTYGMRNIVTVVAVPFFFMASGFLLFRKLNALSAGEKGLYFKKYIKRLALMYLLWSAVYFPFVLTEWLHNGCTVTDVLQYVKRFFFEGSYSTIWFLPALITATAFVYFLRKKLPMQTIVLIAIPFYLFACLGSSYYGLTEKIPILNTLFQIYYSFFDSIKNGLLFGFIYVALGALFAERKTTEHPIRALLLSAVLFVLMAGETLVQSYLKWSTNGVDTKLLLVPLSICLFAWVLSVKCPPSKVYIFLRKLSLLMFLSQRIFLTLFERHLSDTILVQNSLLYFASILILTLAFSTVFILLSEKVKILKYFY
ncbi:MAG: acyltransferase [Candidatus Fimenecus sp.]